MCCAPCADDSGTAAGAAIRVQIHSMVTCFRTHRPGRAGNTATSASGSPTCAANITTIRWADRSSGCSSTTTGGGSRPSRSPSARPMPARSGSIRAASDRFISAHGMDDEQIARIVSELQIDIAVDLDRFAARARPGILARRPAALRFRASSFPTTPRRSSICRIPISATTRSARYRRAPAPAPRPVCRNQASCTAASTRVTR